MAVQAGRLAGAHSRTRDHGAETRWWPLAARADRADGVLHVRSQFGRALHALLRPDQRARDGAALHQRRAQRGLLLGRPPSRLRAHRTRRARQAARHRAVRVRPDRLALDPARRVNDEDSRVKEWTWAANLERSYADFRRYAARAFGATSG